MILALAYSHKDCHQAFKLLSWVSFLSEQAGGSLKNDTVLLIPSRHAAQKKVHEEAQEFERYFGRLIIHVPAAEHEVGWPGAANFMFKEALTFCDLELNEPMFWLEPDAVPLHPQWWQTIKDEYNAAGKPFMGGEVLTGWKHMSGIGVYGTHWETLAPSLASVPDNSSWDMHAAGEMLPWTHFTPLIQHVNKTPPITDLSMVNSEAVVFHQDKQLRLIKLLAKQYGAGLDKVFTEIVDHGTNEPDMSTRFFYTPNSTKVIESQGLQFAFEPVGVFGGLMRGVYATDKESEVIALSALANMERSPVKEITPERYEELAKKKPNRQANSTASLVMPPIAGERSAVRVENPASTPKPTEVPKVNVVNSLEEILKVGTVKPLEPINGVSTKVKPPRHKATRR